MDDGGPDVWGGILFAIVTFLSYKVFALLKLARLCCILALFIFFFTCSYKLVHNGKEDIGGQNKRVHLDIIFGISSNWLKCRVHRGRIEFHAKIPWTAGLRCWNQRCLCRRSRHPYKEDRGQNVFNNRVFLETLDL